MNIFHFDIYKTQLNDDGQWSKAEPLPAAVNTLFNEDSPEVSADGKTLFFSSDRTDGFGGYDIYYFKVNGADDVIYRLDQPINSPAHDIYFKMLADSSAAFLSSNRLKGYGGMDIYKVAFYERSRKGCASPSDELVINGADSVLLNSRLILTSDGSALNNQQPRKIYWTINNEVLSTGRRLEKLVDEVGELNIIMHVSTLDSVSQSFTSSCAQKMIKVLPDSLFHRNGVLQEGLSALRNGATENETLLKLPASDSSLELTNDVVTTYTNTPVYINALDNDPAVNKGSVALTAISRPGHGSSVIENKARGVILYYPTTDFNGSDTFSYTAMNETGTLGKAWIGVRVLDKQPFVYAKIVREDTAYALVDKAVSIRVFENDIMKEGVRYKISETTPPQNGEIKGIDLNGGVFIYQPKPNFIGQDVFTYAVDAPKEGRQRTLVRVNVGLDSTENIARTSPDFASTFQSNMVSFNVLLNDDFSAEERPRIVSISKTAMGATQIYDAQRGTIVYAPLTSFIGFDNFTYTVELADGSRHVEAVSISVLEEEILESAETDEPKEETEILDITSVDKERINSDKRPTLELKSIYFDFDKTYIR